MPDRQEIIATNKSLRLIKNELENLLEKGIVDDSVFDSIMRILPAEASLASAVSTPTSRQTSIASPAPTHNPLSPPVNSMANLSFNSNGATSPAPPAYNATGPPSLPQRNNAPPPPPPSKPVIAHAKALYKYAAADDRDLSFERDDKIAVFEYMNDDWWMGKNVRTGSEGIFPKNYVEMDSSSEKSGFYASAQPTYAQGPPQGQNPYNSNVPPMAVAEGSQQQEGQSGKGSEMGKKIGKKLGNAAIFGAGATLGGNLVNSIF